MFNPAEEQKGGGGNAGLMYHQLKKFISVIDDLRDVGVQKFVKLPRIAVLGSLIYFGP